MEEFTSPNLQLILSIKEGANFDRIQKPIVILATVNSQCLETAVIQADCNPIFMTDLAWDIDQKILRRMRSQQTPVKVECFCIGETGYREKIGYILQNIRCAQIVYKGRESDIKVNWHTLLGVKSEFHTCKPKLLISFYVREKPDPKTVEMLKMKQFSDLGQFGLAGITPVLCPNEQLIQLGPSDICHELFLLAVTAESAMNLNQLGQPNDENVLNIFRIHYNILDNNISLKSFKLQDSNCAILNEKIVIRMKSSLEALMTYFHTKSHFSVLLEKNNTMVGQTSVNLKSLVTTNNIRDFLLKNKNATSNVDYLCVLKNINHILDNNGDFKKEFEVSSLPNLKINVKLQYIGSKDTLHISQQNTQHVPESQNLLSHSNPLQNTQYLPESTHCLLHNTQTRCKAQSFAQNAQNVNTNFTISNGNPIAALPRSHSYTGNEFFNENIKCNAQLSQRDYSQNSGAKLSARTQCMEMGEPNRLISANENHRRENLDYPNKIVCNSKELKVPYHFFNVNITLNSIFFVEEDFKPIDELDFRLLSCEGYVKTLRSDNVHIRPGLWLQIKNLNCKLLFVSTWNAMEQISKLFELKIDIFDKKDCIAEAELGIDELFKKKKPEYRYETTFVDLNTSKEKAHLDLTVSLENYDLILSKNLDSCTLENIEPVLFDDAYKVADELETWKEKQQEIFKSELRKREQNHMSLLNEEWQRRREFLEHKLNQGIEQCKASSRSLNEAAEALRSRKISSFEKETKLLQENEELRWKYEKKIEQIEESLQKSQSDLSSKITDLEEQNKELLHQADALTSKNKELQRVILEQSKEILSYKEKEAIREQKNSLLLEIKRKECKLATSDAEDKSVYEQGSWEKTMEEVHKRNVENQQVLDSHRQDSEEEVHEYDIAKILRGDYEALACDTVALNEIQQNTEAFTIPHLSKYQSDDLGLHFRSSRLATENNPPCEVTEKLNLLITEKERLLKTGSYTEEDKVIKSLNSEIISLQRSLLL